MYTFVFEQGGGQEKGGRQVALSVRALILNGLTLKLFLTDALTELAAVLHRLRASIVKLKRGGALESVDMQKDDGQASRWGAREQIEIVTRAGTAMQGRIAWASCVQPGGDRHAKLNG